MWDQGDSPVLMDCLERPEQQDSQDYPGLTEPRVQLDQPDLPGLLDPMVNLVSEVTTELMVSPEIQV